MRRPAICSSFGIQVFPSQILVRESVP
jgi:hypothetical protein